MLLEYTFGHNSAYVDAWVVDLDALHIVILRVSCLQHVMGNVRDVSVVLRSAMKTKVRYSHYYTYCPA